jgi:hypothetical protein
MTTRVRITQSMIDFLKQQDGEEGFDQFKRDCCKIYLILRKHYNLFANFLALVTCAKPSMDCSCTMEELKDFIDQRFLPGSPSKEAEQFFKTILESSIEIYVDQEKWATYLVSQLQTMYHTVSYTSSTISETPTGTRRGSKSYAK